MRTIFQVSWTFWTDRREIDIFGNNPLPRNFGFVSSAIEEILVGIEPEFKSMCAISMDIFYLRAKIL
jgi:hypothetical protein